MLAAIPVYSLPKGTGKCSSFGHLEAESPLRTPDVRSQSHYRQISGGTRHATELSQGDEASFPTPSKTQTNQTVNLFEHLYETDFVVCDAQTTSALQMNREGRDH